MEIEEWRAAAQRIPRFRQNAAAMVLFMRSVRAGRKKNRCSKKTHNQFQISLQEKNSQKAFFFLSTALTGCIPNGR